MIDWLRKWLLPRKGFERIQISREVTAGICEIARSAHPKEMLSFLEGKIEKGTLKITGLLFQEYFADENSAFAKINFPLGLQVVGTVHSHPGYSNRPSDADLFLFSKHGIAHLIIKMPYRPQDIAVYDSLGRKLHLAAM